MLDDNRERDALTVFGLGTRGLVVGGEPDEPSVGIARGYFGGACFPRDRHRMRALGRALAGVAQRAPALLREHQEVAVGPGQVLAQPVAQRAAREAARVEEVAEEQQRLDGRAAVLAALNIADECFRIRADEQSRRESVTSRAEELERMLDLALGLADTETSRIKG